MNAAGHLFATLAATFPVLARLLVTALWQGGLLTLGVAALLRLLPGMSASSRTRIWAVTVALIFVLPVLPTVLSHGGRVGSSGAGVRTAEWTLTPGWSVGLVVFSLGLSVWQAFLLLRNARRVRGVVRRSTVVNAAGTRLPVRVSAEVSRPSLAGLLHPCVLLPAGLLENLSAEELAHVLLHEEEHLRRGDLWLNVLQQASLLLLPIHPALHWLNRRLCQERELACDEGVLQATAARQAYAACLVKLAEDSMLRRGVHLALGLLGAGRLGAGSRQSELVGRVQRILAGPAQLPLWSRRLATGAVCGGMVLATGLFERAPQLVSFEKAEAPSSLAAMSGMAPMPLQRTVSIARMQPAAERLVSGGARPVLTGAVLTTSPKPAVWRPAALGFRRRAEARVKRRERVQNRSVAAPWAVRRASVEVPQFAAAPPRVVPVLMREVDGASFQPVYAAVPWRNGWLIVQL